MTFEFEHKKEPRSITIEAEFKGRPKVFEVAIIKYEQFISNIVKKEEVMLSNSQSRTFKSTFWNNAKQIFDSIIKPSAFCLLSQLLCWIIRI